jgi:hypothetical protein
MRCVAMQARPTWTTGAPMGQRAHDLRDGVLADPPAVLKQISLGWGYGARVGRERADSAMRRAGLSSGPRGAGNRSGVGTRW